MKKIVTSLLASALGLTAFTQSVAGTNTGTLEVTATVESSCTITTAPVSFGTYDPVAPKATTAKGKISLSCTKGTKPNLIRLDYGKNSAGTQARSMSTESGTDLLPYELYKPLAAGGECSDANSEIWGNTTLTGLTVTDVASLTTPASYNVCGKINTGQDVKPGAYKDSVTVTVEF